MNHADGDYLPIMERAPLWYIDALRLTHNAVLEEGNPATYDLIHKLITLSDGGTVILQHGANQKTFDHEELNQKGSFREFPSMWCKMIPQHCFDNSVCFTKRMGGVVVIGYAYRDDEREWRSHAWVEKEGVIIETCTPRDMYFGMELKNAE